MTDRCISRREYEVLVALANGHNNPSAGRLLGIQECTVRDHRRSILAKLDAFTVAHAVALAMRRGLIRGDEIDDPETSI